MCKRRCDLCSALPARVKKSVHISLKVQIRTISGKSGSSPQISNPRHVHGPHGFCTSQGGGGKQHTLVESFEKGSIKVLFSEMQVGSMKATGSQ